MSAVQDATRRKTKVAVMNAVHDLPVLVARDKGYFRDEELDIEFVTTPGMAQVTTSHTVKFDTVFDRPLDSVYNEGGIDQYRMCEWGIMKRAVEADTEGRRRRKIVALGASMSKFAIVVDKGSKIYEPEMLKDKLISVTPNNGSHFTMLKMVEGFLEPQHVKTTNAGSMAKRIEALRRGEVAAVVVAAGLTVRHLVAVGPVAGDHAAGDDRGAAHGDQPAPVVLRVAAAAGREEEQEGDRAHVRRRYSNGQATTVLRLAAPLPRPIRWAATPAWGEPTVS